MFRRFIGKIPVKQSFQNIEVEKKRRELIKKSQFLRQELREVNKQICDLGSARSANPEFYRKHSKFSLEDEIILAHQVDKLSQTIPAKKNMPDDAHSEDKARPSRRV